jgi:hypothetical protein
MAKKIRLQTDQDYGAYTMIALSCHLKDYRISFLINKHLQLNLKKTGDFQYFPLKTEQALTYSLYYHHDPERMISRYLVSNHHPNGKLFPTLKQTDYFLVIEGVLETKEKQEMIRTLLSVPLINMAFEVDIPSLKNVRYFLEDLEMHMNEIRKSQ